MGAAKEAPEARVSSFTGMQFSVVTLVKLGLAAVCVTLCGVGCTVVMRRHLKRKTFVVDAELERRRVRWKKLHDARATQGEPDWHQDRPLLNAHDSDAPSDLSDCHSSEGDCGPPPGLALSSRALAPMGEYRGHGLGLTRRPSQV